MDLDQQLKDIRMGILSEPLDWVNKSTLARNTEVTVAQMVRARDEYEASCKKYGIPPYWTEEGKQRVHRIIEERYEF